MERRSYISIR